MSTRLLHNTSIVIELQYFYQLSGQKIKSLHSFIKRNLSWAGALQLNFQWYVVIFFFVSQYVHLSSSCVVVKLSKCYFSGELHF